MNPTLLLVLLVACRGRCCSQHQHCCEGCMQLCVKLLQEGLHLITEAW